MIFILVSISNGKILIRLEIEMEMNPFCSPGHLRSIFGSTKEKYKSHKIFCKREIKLCCCVWLLGAAMNMFVPP